MVVVKVSNGTDTLIIHSVNLVINFAKEPMAEFEIPIVYPWSEEPETRIIDALKVKKSITISGLITTSSLSGATSIWDVYNKIVDFMEGGGCLSLRVTDASDNVRIDWGDPSDVTTFRAYPEKYQFTINPTDEDNPSYMNVSLVFKHAMEQNQATS